MTGFRGETGEMTNSLNDGVFGLLIKSIAAVDEIDLWKTGNIGPTGVLRFTEMHCELSSFEAGSNRLCELSERHWK